MSAQTSLMSRCAHREDAAAMARIYNQGIEDRIATFETKPRTIADIERLLDERLGRYPAIVVERDGHVCGVGERWHLSDAPLLRIDY